MGIIKEARIVSVRYPNGNVANLTLGEYQGAYKTVGNRKVIDSLNRFRAVQNNQMFEFDIPVVGSSAVWTFTFSGKYAGQNLPSFTVTINHVNNSQIDVYMSAVVVSGVVLATGPSSYGYINPTTNKWYFAIGRGNPTNDNEINVFIGLASDTQYLNDIRPFNVATLFFNSSTAVEFNPTYGSITNPDKYESVPNDASGATMEDTSDIITIDALPSAVYAGGLFRIYELTAVQMTSLSNELTDPTIIEALVRTVTSPLDYVVSLKAMPVTFTGTDSTLRLGNYESTDVGRVKQLNNFLFDIDCGYVTIPRYFDSFLDWSPYTNATIYLPFIGYVSLNLDKFIGDIVNIKYRVDAVSGDCIAFISNGESLISTYSGNCAYNLPLRANDSSAIVAGLYSALSGIVMNNGGQFSQGAFQIAEGVMKPNIVSTSGLSANAGSMCNRKPYLIIERPHVSLPKSYPKNIGYMCRISAKLSDLHGYTEVEAIHLDHVTATREEKAELEALLRNGVVLP